MRLAATLPPFRALPRVVIGPVLIYLFAVFLLAGIVHIVTILLVPGYAQSDGWSRLDALAGQGRFQPISSVATDPRSIPGLDPLFMHAACRIDLSEAPATVTLSARERFWSMALYDPSGRVVFSLNDRTAVEGELAMLVATPLQNSELKETAAAETDTIVVESASTALVALLRLYAPTAGSRRESEAVIAGARCAPGVFDGADPGPPATMIGPR